MSSPFFSQPPTQRRSRGSATILAINNNSHIAIQKILRNNSINEEISAFYSRQANGIPPIPKYLEKSAYSQLLETQYSIFLRIRDPNKAKNLDTYKSPLCSNADNVPRRPSSMSSTSSSMSTERSQSCSSQKTEKPTAKEFEALKSYLEYEAFNLLLIRDLRLPTGWNTRVKGEHIDISVDYLQLTFRGHNSDVSSVEANHYIKKQCGVYYFEVQLISKVNEDGDAEISIGLSTDTHSTDKMPGCDESSWGYNGWNGHISSGVDTEKPYGPKFGISDTIGCGIDFNDMSAFYTKNGVYIGTAFEVNTQFYDFYPCVGFKTSGAKVRGNFGFQPFEFNIQQYMSSKKQKLLDSMSLSPISNAKSTIAGASLTSDVADNIVLDYLRHNGYDNTAKSLEDALTLKRQQLNEDYVIENEDIDLKCRKEIKNSVLKEDFNKTLKLCDKYYPDVLDNNPISACKLKCREFMNLVRKLNEQELGKDSYRDETNMQKIELSQISGNIPKRRHNSSVDTDYGQKRLKSSEGLDKLQSVIHYGRSIQSEFHELLETNEVVKSEVKDAISTLAYSDLTDSRVAYLYGTSRLESLASELNSAILVSLGESSKSTLERIYCQTKAIIDILVLMGDAKAALLQPEEDCFQSLDS